ncbi:MAG TPA: peptidylprolyl isomerase [Vicinamibacterales bacterium]|nr:peptidylprolyl isomerase [Vicinamibacterales bacterium]
MPGPLLRATRRSSPVILSLVLAGCGAEPPDPARVILELENARPDDAGPLVDALSNPDPRVQALAARALGRLERPDAASAVLALAASPDEAVRREVATALGQIGAPVDVSVWLDRETDGGVRGALYEAMGRTTPIEGVTERRLVRGLSDADAMARSGAAHGLEAFLRLNRRTHRPSAETIAALRIASTDDLTEVRELALLTLNGAGDADIPTLEGALGDREPQVRRLAVLGLGRWIDDPSPIVRYDALRVDPTCERATAALADDSGHVRLLAIDLLGTLPCQADVMRPLLAPDQPWRVRAHALVSLARVAPEAARSYLPAAAAEPVWQARAYAATAARLVGDEATRAALAADAEPNVVIAAMTEPAEAVRALATSHRGLLRDAARLLEGVSELADFVPALTDAFARLTREDWPTTRDARLALLDRLLEAAQTGADMDETLGVLRPALSDRDPVVAARVAEVLAAATGSAVSAATTRYVDSSLPSADYISGLAGATARFTMAAVGSFTVELLVDEAPATVAIFAQHAERGGYDGTTLHRVVPNFVLQGGSHGANEYDGAVGPFMRDEVGSLRHLRGTLGISTRGRDTGDGQIFINLVDNFRLDYQYTVWARVIDGMDVVDRILEGDVIEAVRVQRR